jgi:hypothetical protein
VVSTRRQRARSGRCRTTAANQPDCFLRSPCRCDLQRRFPARAGESCPRTRRPLGGIVVVWVVDVENVCRLVLLADVVDEDLMASRRVRVQADLFDDEHDFGAPKSFSSTTWLSLPAPPPSSPQTLPRTPPAAAAAPSRRARPTALGFASSCSGSACRGVPVPGSVAVTGSRVQAPGMPGPGTVALLWRETGGPAANLDTGR